MDKCFVIQPFDNGMYDKRYVDVFKPAIEKADLEPYRVDMDLSVRIPIEEIERGIYESSMCFAEISTNNPNVWYELGYAFACGKDVIMVCSNEREGKFPFDIQHRQIIRYSTGSKSDYEELEENITKRIRAYQHNKRTVNRLQTVPVVGTEGLKGHEIAFLVLLMEEQLVSGHASMYSLKNGMERSGYNAVAASAAIIALKKKNMIETFHAMDDNTPDTYNACRITETGEEWIFNNQHEFVFRKNKSGIDDVADDLPF
ncbi:MAG: hypothetical protein EOO43_17935 [Flavobacterium sp.]|nr:MAG: hypothetical protein EOO43_17935 [Flavobacterium sp.]